MKNKLEEIGHNTGQKSAAVVVRFIFSHPSFVLSLAKGGRRLAGAALKLGELDRNNKLIVEATEACAALDDAIDYASSYKKAVDAFENSLVLAPCPVCGAKETMPVAAVIMHLNDEHEYKFAAIADWLDTLPYDFSLREDVSPSDLEKLVIR